MSDDFLLLEKYAHDRDAEAFSALVGRHTALVHGTCLRMLGNPHDAEDVTQECFLELARRPDAIARSVPGWLHTLATSRSKDYIRNAVTRRTHETHAMTDQTTVGEPTWETIAPQVDEALEALPDELRQPLILHYLQSKSQAETAEVLGINQSTVSRRLGAGVEELRTRLSKAGIVASVALLASLLATNASAVAVPASLAASLGKMALAGVGKGAGTTATHVAVGGLFSTATAKIAALLVAGLALTGGIMLINRSNHANAADSPKDQRKQASIGSTVTFRTESKAPDQFDAWTFFWTMPRLENPAAALDFARVLPNQQDLRFHRIRETTAGISIRSDTTEPDEVVPAQGQECRVVFRVDSGRIRFSRHMENFSFAFYKRNADGEIDWDKPFKAIPAVIEASTAPATASVLAKANAAGDGISTAGIEAAKRLKDQNWVGKTLTFRTADKAPEQFDAWTFFWTAPKLQDFDATLDYVVLLPDSKEHFVYRDIVVKPGDTPRSDFEPGFSGGDIGPLQGQVLRIMFRVDLGTMAFPIRPTGYAFAFYRKDKAGKIDWRRPFRTIPAVIETIDGAKPLTGAGIEGHEQVRPGPDAVKQSYRNLLMAMQEAGQNGDSLAAAFITNGIVAYYPLDGDANDMSGNSYHGVAYGVSSAVDRLGVAGGACHLDDESYITLDHRAFDGLGDFTIAVWVRLDHLQTTGRNAQNSILSLANQESDNEFLLHRGLVSPSGAMSSSIAANICGKAGKNYCRFPGSGLSTGTWQHVVFVREGNKATLYQQGERIGVRPAVDTELRVDEGGAILGQEQDTVGGGFESHQSLLGSLDDLFIFNRAISAEEVRLLFRMKWCNAGENVKGNKSTG